MSDFLDGIVSRKRMEVSQLQRRRSSAGSGGGVARQMKSVDSFLDALTGGTPPRIIAEVKRSSPSKGEMAPGLDPSLQARAYEAGGACALSVLTDEAFQGSLEDLRCVVASVKLPVLRKDFIIDGLQVLEALEAGASAVLLIAAILGQEELEELVEYTLSLGMEPLVEVHTEEELARVLATRARVIGINNRDLTTFQVDLKVAETLAPLALRDRVVVAESGISDGGDIERLQRVGLENFLVGESLVRAQDPKSKLRGLRGHG
jgi:indole-3-glycerol phosphate synthase/phosphoribosylanthranilate isomerase/anthranilate synthase/indole-3-glycerol phosphate synthase/phosphoribosylanthranilate isomerase